MFVDRCKVYVKAGDGGNGCASFRREKFVPKGGPDGGDGGNGGDVIFVADVSQSSLVDLKFGQHVEARRGDNGMGKQKHGRNGEDKVVLVPPGTIIYDFENDHYKLADLREPGRAYRAARGGRGGKGNMHFVTSTNRAPRVCEQGIPGEERVLFLELKVIADVGLVGYPNAGKSTFVNAVSRAGMKTASYPFTTLHPSVGVVDFPDFTRMTIADIPGLVEGAHENVGLGHHFLRHIERTKALCYVLDMAGTDGRSPLDDLNSLIQELELYQQGLSKRAVAIIANKMDEAGAVENLEELEKHVELPVFQAVAELKDGIDPILQYLKECVEEVRQAEAEGNQEVIELHNIYQESDSVIVDLDEDDDDFLAEEEDEFDDLDWDESQLGFEDWDEELDLEEEQMADASEEETAPGTSD